jgi:ubiquinone/menaquinone biosynthesis C-methylase UbiE
MPKRSDQDPVRWVPFERLADRYDAWFDSEKGRRIFRAEAECIRDLLVEMPRPWLEVGVGTGRFAVALDIDEGVDPSPAVLRYASQRGVQTRLGRAEELPYEGNRFGVTLLVVTTCFLDDPAQALRECRRVLREDGYAIVGLVPKDSRWGEAYARKGIEGHPFYSAAQFYTAGEVVGIAEQAGFYLNRATSCLFEGPDRTVERYQRPREGVVADAGFVGLRFGIDNNGDKLRQGE